MDSEKIENANMESVNEEVPTPHKPVNGLAQHEEIFLTAEEIKAERKFVLKIDLLILPLLIIMFFLASLVRGPFHG
jgi:hypothetical protein